MEVVFSTNCAETTNNKQTETPQEQNKTKQKQLEQNPTAFTKNILRYIIA